MKTFTQHTCGRPRNTLHVAFVTLAATFSLATYAGPGAHGPGGEHLDAPGASVSAGNASPRVESKSETFELVGRLENGVLSILIDRYETNEPVLDASVDIESGGAKAKAAFRADQGDYVVTDPAMLKLLSGPDTYSLIFTISAGKDSDLLDGKLFPGSAAASHVSAGATRGMAIAAWTAAVLGIGAVVFFFWRRRNARRFGYQRAGGVR
ncbi:MAG: hypothetical protein ABI790_03210 [Betaproteobacteria bacterium]